jgi:hypothetical protein
MSPKTDFKPHTKFQYSLLDYWGSSSAAVNHGSVWIRFLQTRASGRCVSNRDSPQVLKNPRSVQNVLDKRSGGVKNWWKCGAFDGILMFLHPKENPNRPHITWKKPTTRAFPVTTADDGLHFFPLSPKLLHKEAVLLITHGTTLLRPHHTSHQPAIT